MPATTNNSETTVKIIEWWFCHPCSISLPSLRYSPYQNFPANLLEDILETQFLEAAEQASLAAEPTKRPTADKTVKDLPRTKLTKKLLQDLNLKDAKCMVCIDNFKTTQTVITLPCKHVFHTKCICPWLKEDHVCPICRDELPSKSAPTNTSTSTTSAQHAVYFTM